MASSKTLISEAIARFPLQATAEWARVTAAGLAAGVVRIEPDVRTISTVDNLFDGAAHVVLEGSRIIEARVFGRFSERRAEVDRIVLAA